MMIKQLKSGRYLFSNKLKKYEKSEFTAYLQFDQHTYLSQEYEHIGPTYWI
jgi:hypothetical protein